MIKATALAALVLGANGCFWFTTKHEGDQLRTDVDRLDKRMSAQEETLGAQVAKLKEVLDQATKLLARNSADLGTQVQGFGEEQQKLNGLVMDAQRTAEAVRDSSARLEQRLEALEKRLAEVEAKAEQTSKSPGQLWDEGQAALKAGRYEDARSSFRLLIVKYPTDGKADDAQMARGESYYAEKKYQESLGEFQRVFEKYPDSTLADDAAYRAGEAAEQLKWCTDARAYFGLIEAKWPKSDLVKKAKSKDAELKKNAKNKDKCQS